MGYREGRARVKTKRCYNLCIPDIECKLQKCNNKKYKEHEKYSMKKKNVAIAYLQLDLAVCHLLERLHCDTFSSNYHHSSRRKHVLQMQLSLSPSNI